MRKTGEKTAWWHAQRVQASDAAALAVLPKSSTNAARLQTAAGSIVNSMSAIADAQSLQAAVQAGCAEVRQTVKTEVHPGFARAFLHAVLFCCLEPLSSSLRDGDCVDTLAASSLWRLPVDLYASLALTLSFQDLLVDCLCCFGRDLSDSGASLAAEIFWAQPELALRAAPRLLLPPMQCQTVPAPPLAVVDAAVSAMRKALSSGDTPLVPMAAASVRALARRLAEALEAGGEAASPSHVEALSDILSGPTGDVLASGGPVSSHLLLRRLQTAVSQSVQAELSPGGLGASAPSFASRCHLRTRLMLLLGPEGDNEAAIPSQSNAEPSEAAHLSSGETPGRSSAQMSWQHLVGGTGNCTGRSRRPSPTDMSAATDAANDPSWLLLSGDNTTGGEEAVLAVTAVRCLPGMPSTTNGLQMTVTSLSPARGGVSLALLLQQVCGEGFRPGVPRHLFGLLTSTLSEVSVSTEQTAVAEVLLLHPTFADLRRQLAAEQFASELPRVRKELIKVSNRMAGDAGQSREVGGEMLSRLFGDSTTRVSRSTADMEDVIHLALPHCVLFPKAALERFVSDSLTHPGQQPAVLTVLSRLWALGGAGEGSLLPAALCRQLQAMDPHAQAQNASVSVFVSALVGTPPHQPLLSMEAAVHDVAVHLLEEAALAPADSQRAVFLTSMASSVITAAAQIPKPAGGCLSASPLLSRQGPSRLLAALLKLADPGSVPTTSAQEEAEELLRAVAHALVAAAEAEDQTHQTALRELRALAAAAWCCPWRTRLVLMEALLLASQPPDRSGDGSAPSPLPERLASASLWPASLTPVASAQDTARDLFTLWAVRPESVLPIHNSDLGGGCGDAGVRTICRALTTRLLAVGPLELRRCVLAEVCRSVSVMPASQATLVLSTALPHLLATAIFAASCTSGGGLSVEAEQAGKALSLEITGRAVVVCSRLEATQGGRGHRPSRRLLQHFCALAKALSHGGGGAGEQLAARALHEAIAVYGQIHHQRTDCSGLQVLLLQLVDRLMLCDVDSAKSAPGVGTDASHEAGLAGWQPPSGSSVYLAESLGVSYGCLVEWIRGQAGTVPEASCSSRIEFAVGKREADRRKALALAATQQVPS